MALCELEGSITSSFVPCKIKIGHVTWAIDSLKRETISVNAFVWALEGAFEAEGEVEEKVFIVIVLASCKLIYWNAGATKTSALIG